MPQVPLEELLDDLAALGLDGERTAVLACTAAWWFCFAGRNRCSVAGLLLRSMLPGDLTNPEPGR